MGNFDITQMYRHFEEDFDIFFKYLVIFGLIYLMVNVCLWFIARLICPSEETSSLTTATCPATLAIPSINKCTPNEYYNPNSSVCLAIDDDSNHDLDRLADFENHNSQTELINRVGLKEEAGSLTVYWYDAGKKCRDCARNFLNLMDPVRVIYVEFKPMVSNSAYVLGKLEFANVIIYS